MAKKTTTYNDNNLAIAYYRFSSVGQRDVSISQQRQSAHQYATSKGLTIIKEYEDRGISGTSEDRPGFQLMLSEVGKIRPAALIAWKRDRLSRNMYLFTMAKKIIEDAGCRLNYVAEATADNDLDSVLLDGVLGSYAELFSKQLRQNVIRGMRFNAEKAMFNGHVLFGYGTGADKRYAIDPLRAPLSSVFLPTMPMARVPRPSSTS